MGEEKINRVKVGDLPQPEEELTPDEAQQVRGGDTSDPDSAKSGEDFREREGAGSRIPGEEKDK